MAVKQQAAAREEEDEKFKFSTIQNKVSFNSFIHIYQLHDHTGILKLSHDHCHTGIL